MREENKYTVNGNTNDMDNMYHEYTVFSTDSNSSKNIRRRMSTRIAASIMAMALVSAGSIGIYHHAFGTDKNITAVVAETTEEETAEKTSVSAVSAENVSYITPTTTNSGELTTEEVVEKVLPSVVGIESTFTMTSQNSSGYYNFGGFGGMNGFGQDQQPQTSTATATGTGVIITADGYIVTNAHVIYDSEYGAGIASSISVIVNEEDRYDAEVIGYDTDCDLAVLKISAEGLTATEFGNSDELNLGQDVIAIGNPLGFDLMNTVTSGIVSGLNRQITINEKSMTLIQTDAAINSGNSGGPLINKKGQVIGINSSKMSASYSETSIEGIGFAIPSNEAARIVEDIMEYGYVKGKPQLGISCQDITENISRMYNLPVGVYITEVKEGSAAEKSGLQEGDIITMVNDEAVTTYEELTAKKNEHKAGETIELTFVRNGSEEKVTVTLDEAIAEQN
ncbi:MAG: trypsin-like peptidase domain-containing protein [Ruminococcus sp.]|uniref:S1C family serine protease n=1 Tax=Ruminococcus sp. TaxID=41978 RepID=UPI0025D2F45A|nr:trypsin-like peptidase domain-containing protein [Ruminococcus sp.]MCR5600379.1 trypsin-like peptidase domain-containing protein [Ruminococcus sp.]